MGTDCVFIAENKNEITFEDYAKAAAIGFLGGHGGWETFPPDCLGEAPRRELKEPRYAYHCVEVYSDYIIVHDGCRYRDESGYKEELAQWLANLTGGPVAVVGDQWELHFIDDLRRGSCVVAEYLVALPEEDEE